MQCMYVAMATYMYMYLVHVTSQGYLAGHKFLCQIVILPLKSQDGLSQILVLPLVEQSNMERTRKRKKAILMNKQSNYL